MKNNPIVLSLGHAVLASVYIILVVWMISNGERLFGQEESFWIPVAMLMLFVLSATVVGSLVLGRPILMYIDGAKKQALEFLGFTVGWLFALTVLVFLVMVVSK